MFFYRSSIRMRKGGRSLLSGIAVTAALLCALAGCSGTTSQTAPAAAGPASQPAPAAAPEKRVIKHAGGETEITGVPKKAAVLDYRLADSLIALGVKPYAMTTFLGGTQLPWIDGNPTEGVVSLGDTTNLEAVLKAAPDLIIGRTPDLKVYDQLSKVAPTVITEIEGASWRQNLEQLGAIMQREKEAKQWLAAYDQKAARLRSEIEGYIKPGETFLYARIMPKEIRVHGTKELFGATLFEDLKLTPVPGLEKVARVETISLEKLPDYNADYIFLEVGAPTAGGDKNADANLAAISQSAVWKELKAVKAGHVFTMPQWIISDYPNIKSKSLDLIAEQLKKAAGK